MKRFKLNKEKYKMQFEEERSTTNVRKSSPVFKEVKKFKEKFDAKWNKGSGNLRVRPHQAKLLLIRSNS